MTPISSEYTLPLPNDAQMEMIAQCDAATGLDRKIPAYMAIPFAKEDIPGRLYAELEKRGLLTLDAIRSYNPQDLQKLPNVNVKTIFLFTQKVQEWGGWFLNDHKDSDFVKDQIQKGKQFYIDKHTEKSLQENEADEYLKDISVLSLFDKNFSKGFGVHDDKGLRKHKRVKSEVIHKLDINKKDSVFSLRSLSTKDMQKKGMSRSDIRHFTDMVHEISGRFKDDENLLVSVENVHDFYETNKAIVTLNVPINPVADSLELN